MPDWPKHKAVGDDEANGFAFVPIQCRVSLHGIAGLPGWRTISEGASCCSPSPTGDIMPANLKLSTNW
jgi:hypothetical protein